MAGIILADGREREFKLFCWLMTEIKRLKKKDNGRCYRINEERDKSRWKEKY